MHLFLGIDGGGSGCRAAVCDASGRILGEARGGPANIATDTDRARANILAVAAAALPEGVPLASLRTVMGLAGANVADSVARFSQGLPFHDLRVVTDAVTAAKGALNDADGIVAAIGTGSVYASQRDRVIRQIGGWGLVLGDEGSGAWIGRRILARSLRAADGFVPDTALLRALRAEMGGPDGVVAFAQSADPADLARLAPRILDADDPAARAVMSDAAVEVAAAIDLLQAGSNLPVIFLGGLGAPFAARLESRWPVRPALGSGLDGALRLARAGG